MEISLSIISISTSPRANGAAMSKAVRYWLLIEPESFTWKKAHKKGRLMKINWLLKNRLRLLLHRLRSPLPKSSGHLASRKCGWFRFFIKAYTESSQIQVSWRVMDSTRSAYWVIAQLEARHTREQSKKEQNSKAYPLLKPQTKSTKTQRKVNAGASAYKNLSWPHHMSNHLFPNSPERHWR